MTRAMLRSLYSESSTFMDMLLECSRFIDEARADPHCQKEDVLTSLENRVSLMIGKMAGHPTSSAFAIQLDGHA